VPSILGAVRARLVNELVTDTVTARALLAESTRAS
jgi:DNA-binding transcriptional regulator LsrR (DeoR family)